VKAGGKAPDFKVVDEAFNPVTLSDFAGKKVLISAVPSLDTPVCSLQTKRFNAEAEMLGEAVAILTISADLPFAQKRFCDAERIGRTRVLSDSVWKDFARNYGVLIKDMGILARSIFIVGKDGTLEYMELVKEVTNHPDYDTALDLLKK
jgi:thiol peroxidase